MLKKLKKGAKDQQKQPLTRAQIVNMLESALDVFSKQPMLVEIEPPINICGDIHGQFVDLIRLFDQSGWPGKTRYLFLGDYVDRGPQNLEVICTMICMKLRFPTDFYILRGNHESRSINRVYGFYEEVSSRYDANLWEHFNKVFDYMPISALVRKRILCMHGGISPSITNLDQIRKLERPYDIPDQGIIADLLWADPDEAVQGFKDSTRGISYRFGADAVRKFCDNLGIDLIARAHQVVHDGYQFFADDQLITLFSAPDYCNQFTNAGGVLVVGADLTCKIKQLASKYDKK